MQILANSVIQGLLFAMIGVAFALVYSTTKIFHIALGAIFAFAPYILLACLSFNMPLFLGIPLTLIAGGILGLLCEELVHWPLQRKRAPSEVHFIASLGLYLVMVQIIILIWGNETTILRQGADSVYSFGIINLTSAQIIAAGVAVTTIAIFLIWLVRSKIGIQFRAMADNPILLSLMGKNVRMLRRILFAVSAVVVSVAALALSNDVGFEPYTGFRIVLIGMVASIIGGSGSFSGAAIAGLMLGILRGQVAWYTSAQWEEAVTLLFLSMVLLFRPQGLFGKKPRLDDKL